MFSVVAVGDGYHDIRFRTIFQFCCSKKHPTFRICVHYEVKYCLISLVFLPSNLGLLLIIDIH